MWLVVNDELENGSEPSVNEAFRVCSNGVVT